MQKRKFSEAFDRVKRHLAMTYHRFLEDKSFKLYWCGHEIKPWNPFCLNEKKLQIMPTDYIGNDIAIKGIFFRIRIIFHQNQLIKMLREYMDFLRIKDFMYIEAIGYC